MSSEISIVIPYFFSELPLLFRAIESILSQSLKAREIIICDDGSDPPLQPFITQRYGLEPCRVEVKVVTHRENRGISAARNSAASIASGKWLCWLDADDTLHKDCLDELWKSAASGKLVVGDCDLYVDGKYYRRRTVSNLERCARLHSRTSEDPFLTHVTSLQPQLVCRDSFFEVGGFSETYRYAEVTEFFLRFLMNCGIEKIKFAPEAIYNYSYRVPDSWSQSRDELFINRHRALNTYRQAINIAGEVVYLKRDPVSGFQVYKLLGNGDKSWTRKSNSRVSMVPG